MLNRTFILGVALFWWLNTPFTTAQIKKSQERLQLKHADEAIYEKREEGQVYKLTGGVQFIQGEAFLTCHEALWWEVDQKLIMTGNVQIHDGEHSLTADRVHYDAIRHQEKASGRVELESNGRILNTQSLLYNQDQARAWCYEGIVITDLIEKTILRGDSGSYDRTLDYGLVVGHASLIREEPAEAETLMITGRKMESWGEKQRAVVTDSVTIEKGDLQGFCQRAVYQVQDHRLILEQMPLIDYRNQRMEGDTIKIDLDDVHFKGGVILGHAVAVSKDSTTEDVLKGQKMIIEASNDTIRSVVVEKQAEGFYHVADEDKQEKGIISVAGDRIVIFFEDGQSKRIRVESDPGLCSGNYTEEAVKPD